VKLDFSVPEVRSLLAFNTGSVYNLEINEKKFFDHWLASFC